MKRILFFLCLVAFCNLQAKEQAPPDTVSVGFYINSVHNIDFKNKDYTINLWLWLKYKNPDFDFSRILAENSRILTWKIEQEKENENFGYSLMEPPVSVWIIRILYFIGLAISIYFAYRVFRRYASEIQTKESQPIESK